jgi:hypothetical protein
MRPPRRRDHLRSVRGPVTRTAQGPVTGSDAGSDARSDLDGVRRSGTVRSDRARGRVWRQWRPPPADVTRWRKCDLSLHWGWFALLLTEKVHRARPPVNRPDAGVHVKAAATGAEWRERHPKGSGLDGVASGGRVVEALGGAARRERANEQRCRGRHNAVTRPVGLSVSGNIRVGFGCLTRWGGTQTCRVGR